jgi:hypothetical protein
MYFRSFSRAAAVSPPPVAGAPRTSPGEAGKAGLARGGESEAVEGRNRLPGGRSGLVGRRGLGPGLESGALNRNGGGWLPEVVINQG